MSSLTTGLETYYQTVDALNVESRNFFERAKAKQSLALFLGSLGLMFLGFCSQAAGQANNELFQSSNQSGGQLKMSQELAAGYGFAAFCFVCGSIIFMALAMYISPFSCGSTNEKKILTYPADVYSSAARIDSYVQPNSM